MKTGAQYHQQLATIDKTREAVKRQKSWKWQTPEFGWGYGK